MQYTSDLFPLQDLLIDIHPKTKKLVPWREKRIQAEKMAEAHIRISQKDDIFINRSSKIYECATFLQFKRFVDTGETKLHRAFFCKYRLCPICMWRRSLKIFSQTSLILNESINQGFQHLFLSLTAKNCQLSELGSALNHFQTSIHDRFIRTKRFKNAITGWIRVFEVTHNIDKNSSSFDTFHHHAHMMLQVRPSYFKKDYIKQSDFQDMWKVAAGLDYDPQVDIRKIDKKNNGDIKEISKYIAKPGDILVDDYDMTDRTVKSLDSALFQRRMVSLGGNLKTIKKQLKLDDMEDGNLVVVDGEKINPELAFVLENYGWNAGFRQYMRKS